MAKDKTVPCLIHIPFAMPDGSEIAPEALNKFLEMFDRQFGGSTPLGIVDGRWVAPDDSIVVEKMHRIEVSVKLSQLSAFRTIARIIGKALKQEAMYVVENLQAETQILFIDDEDDLSGPQTQSAV